MSDSSEAARLEVQEARVKLVMVLVQLAVLAWFLIPPHSRRLFLMRLVEASGRLLSRAAQGSGRASMGTELRTGQEEYTVPLLISLARDQVTELYERIRGN